MDRTEIRVGTEGGSCVCVLLPVVDHPASHLSYHLSLNHGNFPQTLMSAYLPTYLNQSELGALMAWLPHPKFRPFRTSFRPIRHFSLLVSFNLFRSANLSLTYLGNPVIPT